MTVYLAGKGLRSSTWMVLQQVAELWLSRYIDFMSGFAHHIVYMFHDFVDVMSEHITVATVVDSKVPVHLLVQTALGLRIINSCNKACFISRLTLSLLAVNFEDR